MIYWYKTNKKHYNLETMILTSVVCNTENQLKI